MRLLILVLAIALLAFVLKGLLQRPAPAKRGRAQTKLGEKMVPCALCELHLPASEAFREGERFFCSGEHRQQWLNSNSHANERE